MKRHPLPPRPHRRGGITRTKTAGPSSRVVSPKPRSNPIRFTSSSDDSDDIPTLKVACDDAVEFSSSSSESEQAGVEYSWKPPSKIKQSQINSESNESDEEEEMNNSDSHTFEIAKNVNSTSIPECLPVSDDWKSFSIFWIAEHKSFKKISRKKTTLVDQDQTLLYSVKHKNLIFIGSSIDPSPDTEGYKGLIRILDKSTSFLYATSNPRPRDDRDAESMGISFSKNSQKQRAYTVVLPPNGEYNYPITHKKSLVTLSKENLSYGFTLLTSKQGDLTSMDFGTTFFQKSIKEAILENEHQPILIFFRVNEEMFTLKFKSPLTLDQAYAFCLASIYGSTG